MRTLGLVLAAAATLLPGYALAKDGAVRAGVTIGTLGLGPEFGWRPSEMFGLRANAGFFSLNHGETVNGIGYDGKIKLNSFGLLADLYPLGGGLRVSGGVRVNNNKADIVATPTGPVTIGALAYTPAQVGTLAGNVKVNDFSPQLTLGYGGKLARGLMIGLEAGALYQGSPTLSSYTASGSLANDPVFKTNLALEKARVEDEIGKYRFYPVVQVSLGWRF
jgi:hypothetical protein